MQFTDIFQSESESFYNFAPSYFVNKNTIIY